METDSEQYKQPKHVLAIVFDGIEEVEALGPADKLRRAGVETVMVSVGGSKQVESCNGIRSQADQSLSEIDASAFDMVFLPGGPGVLPLAKNALITEIIQSYDHESKFVTAICAAPKAWLKQLYSKIIQPPVTHQLERNSPFPVRTESSSPTISSPPKELAPRSNSALNSPLGSLVRKPLSPSLIRSMQSKIKSLKTGAYYISLGHPAIKPCYLGPMRLFNKSLSRSCSYI